jgi:hypothetical protein
MWTMWERQWLRTIIARTLPPPSPELDPGSVTDAHLSVLLDAMPVAQSLLLRATMWLVLLAGGIAVKRLRPFAWLTGPAQERSIARLSSSRWYAIRQMLVFLKLAACLVRELDPQYRKQVGWGAVPVSNWAAGRP